jgi:hypothetical protein
MKKIDKLLGKFDYEKKSEVQTEILDEFLNFNDEEIQELMNYSHDQNAGLALKYIGFPRLKKFVPNLLEMIEDIHSHAAFHIYDLISDNSELFFDEVKRLLEDQKTNWKGNIISAIKSWDKNLLFKLKELLIELAASYNHDREDALMFLIDNNLITKEELQELILKRDELISTSISIIEKQNWKNLDYLIDNILEIKNEIGSEKLKGYMKVNIQGRSFFSNENFNEDKNLIERMFMKLDKEFLEPWLIKNVAGIWACKTTVDLDNHSLYGIELLINQSLIPKEEIIEIIENNRQTYNRIKDICDNHIKSLNKLENKLNN